VKLTTRNDCSGWCWNRRGPIFRKACRPRPCSHLPATPSPRKKPRTSSEDPFGNLLAQSGTLAEANLYRFSSKEHHPSSGLVYYLYRFYNPALQRWLNRDPLGEPGFEAAEQLGEDFSSPGPKLYTFVQNDAVNQIDPAGLEEKKAKSYWEWVQEMAKKVKDAAKDYEDGKCPKDPCKVPSSLNALCTCMYEAAKQKDVEEMVKCVCQTDPDSDCERKARKHIRMIYGN
jgi:RHS repeat-associated protein